MRMDRSPQKSTEVAWKFQPNATFSDLAEIAKRSRFSLRILSTESHPSKSRPTNLVRLNRVRRISSGESGRVNLAWIAALRFQWKVVECDTLCHTFHQTKNAADKHSHWNILIQWKGMRSLDAVPNPRSSLVPVLGPCSTRTTHGSPGSPW